MSGADLFAGHDPEQLDDVAGRLIQAFTAVADLGRHSHEPALFGAALLKALIFAQAATIANPTERVSDAETERALAAHHDALRLLVADFRRSS